MWINFWTTTTHSLPADNTWSHKIVGKSLKLIFLFWRESIPEACFFLKHKDGEKRNHVCTHLSHSIRTHSHRAIYWFCAFYQTGHLDDLHCNALPCATSLHIEFFLQSCLFACLFFGTTLSQQSLHHLCFRPTL